MDSGCLPGAHRALLRGDHYSRDPLLLLAGDSVFLQGPNP